MVLKFGNCHSSGFIWFFAIPAQDGQFGLIDDGSDQARNVQILFHVGVADTRQGSVYRGTREDSGARAAQDLIDVQAASIARLTSESAIALISSTIVSFDSQSGGMAQSP